MHSIELIMIFEGGVGHACMYCKNRTKQDSSKNIQCSKTPFVIMLFYV